MPPPWLVVYRGLLLVAVLLGVFLVAKAIEYRDKPGGTPLLILTIGALLYVGVKLAVLTVRGTPTVFLFTRGNVLGAGLATLGFFLFAVEFTGLETPVSNRTVGLLSVEPFLASSLVLIDVELFWVPVGRDASTLSGYMWELTSIAIANQLYMTLLLILGVLLLVRFAVRSADAFTAQALALIVAGSAQVAGNASFYLGYVPFNPTPIVFVLSGILVAWGILDKGLLDLVPVGRDAIVDNLDAGVLTVDNSHRVIDINPAARRLFGFEADEQLVGKPLDEAFEGCPQFRSLYWSKTDHEADQAAALEFEDRHFEVEMTTLTRENDTVLGHTMLVRDVTDQYQQREQIRRERNLKELIRSILVQLSSRDELEQAFCEQLASDDRYSFVGIYERTSSGELVDRTVASNHDGESEVDGYDCFELPTEAGLSALETGELTIDRGISSVTTERGTEFVSAFDVRAVAAIPITHNDLTYGVLIVCSHRSESFESEEQQLLTELGESVAFSISVAEQRAALQGDRVREVVFKITDPDHHLLSVATEAEQRDTDLTIDVYDLGSSTDVETDSATDATGTEGTSLFQFLSVQSTSVEFVVTRLRSHPKVQSVTVLRDDEETTSIRVLVYPPSIGSLLSEVGGVVRSIDVTDGAVTVVTEFSTRIDVNRVLAHLRDVYPETSVLSILTKEVDPLEPERDELASLTSKQRQALVAAYHSGFFQRPQRQTAEEIATDLGVSRPTFLRHVRAAEEKLIEAVLVDREQLSAEIDD